MEPLQVGIIVGSTRPNRMSEKIAVWLMPLISKVEGIEVELLDLRDYPLPLYDQPVSPSTIKDGKYGNEIARTWAAKINGKDAFIIIAPEYNHGPTAVLKNALDSIFDEWANKPVAFVAYGSMGGARAVEQLRQIAVELSMAPTNLAVHIVSPRKLLNEQGEFTEGAMDQHSERVQKLGEQLRWGAARFARHGGRDIIAQWKRNTSLFTRPRPAIFATWRRNSLLNIIFPLPTMTSRLMPQGAPK